MASPARITHLAFTINPGDGDPLANVRQLCDSKGIRRPADGALHHGVAVDGGLFKYERHGEFYRISITLSGKNLRGEAVSWLPPGWLDGLPGQRLVAIHTHVLPKTAGKPSDAALQKLFGHDEIACSRVHQGQTTVWSDFRIGADAFTRLLVHEGGASPHRLGRLTRRLHEIETYRMMALLALPVARDLQPRLKALETELSATVEKMATGNGTRNDAELLRKLSGIASDIEQISNQSSYRFTAARAYAALVERRISELSEERVNSYQRLGVFLERRFSPAMATCTAVQARIESLARRAERASNLLRTRVDIALEGQNQQLLRSMDSRARQQLMLQETVEGLSVAAISYYVIGIVGKIIDGVADYVPVGDVKLANLIAIPLVITVVWLAVRRLRRRIQSEAQRKT